MDRRTVWSSTLSATSALGPPPRSDGRLHVWGGASTAVYAEAGAGGRAISGLAFGNGIGVRGDNPDPTGYAGFFYGRVYVEGAVCAANISCASDARLKQNIMPLSYGLREVLRLRPVRWQWKDSTTTQQNLGLVAQEVEPRT